MTLSSSIKPSISKTYETIVGAKEQGCIFSDQGDSKGENQAFIHRVRIVVVANNGMSILTLKTSSDKGETVPRQAVDRRPPLPAGEGKAA